MRAGAFVGARGHARGDRGAGARRARVRVPGPEPRAAHGPEGPGDRGFDPGERAPAFPAPAGGRRSRGVFVFRRERGGPARRGACAATVLAECFACRRGRKDDFLPRPVRHEARASRGRRVGTSPAAVRRRGERRGSRRGEGKG